MLSKRRGDPVRLFRSPIALLAVLALVAGPSATVTAQSPSPATPPAATFNGRIAFGECAGATTELVDGVTKTRGEVCDPQVLEMSDPRLDGDVTVTSDFDVYPDGLTLYTWAFRFENDGGAWQQEPVLTMGYPDGSYSAGTITLVGEGGYEGLTAVAAAPVVNDIWVLDGFIFEGEVPASTGDATP
jgi:hypothetical protein